MFMTIRSRRLSGSVRARACSVSTSSAHPLGLRSSNTLPSLDAISQEDPFATSCGTDNSLGALGFLTPGGPTKLLGFAALGRLPPASCRLPQNENDADPTLSRRLSAGLLWRTSVLCSSTSLNALTQPGLILTQAQAPSATSAAASPPAIQPSDEQLLGPLNGAQAQAHARCCTRTGTTPRAASLAVLSSPAGGPARTLEPKPNPPRGIYVTGPALGKAVPVLSPSVASPSMPSSASSSRPNPVMPPPPAPGPASRAPSGARGAMPTLPPPALAPPANSPQHPPSSSSSSSTPAARPPGITLRAFSHSGATVLPPAPPPTPLHAPSPTSAFVPESPIAHARRTPSPAHTPPMRLQSTAGEHTLSVHLPEGLAPEMVTVCAKKGARLAVVADLWHRESDSHYEWEVAFAPADVDMLSVRAVFEPGGRLVIHVRRRAAVEGLPAPRIHMPL